jgi:hypothetical protein
MRFNNLIIQVLIVERPQLHDIRNFYRFGTPANRLMAATIFTKTVPVFIGCL